MHAQVHVVVVVAVAVIVGIIVTAKTDTNLYAINKNSKRMKVDSLVDDANVI